MLTLETLLDRLSAGPAAIFGLAAPRIAVGARANLTLIDTEASWTVQPLQFKSRSINSWLIGERLASRIRLTVADGRTAYEL